MSTSPRGHRPRARGNGPSADRRDLASALRGRFFFNPTLEYLLIGGGLSLITVAVVALITDGHAYTGTTAFASVVLLSNSSHFAASTVRLYTKPGHQQSWPFLTMLFPLVAFAVLTLCLMQPNRIGSHLQSLYLTWSPYHYAAQAYGLAVMYSFRSGCRLNPSDKKLLWWVAMIPFGYALITTPTAGLFWFVSAEQVRETPALASTVKFLSNVLPVVGFVAPVALFVRIWRTRSGPMPLISLLMVLTNGVWWFTLTGMQAFFWATVFHGIQYLAFVLVFHVKDQMASADNRHGPLYHAAWFYGACLILGYALFHSLPWAYTLAGFGLVESMLLVTAAINVHHFVVDAYIWRLKKGDSNVQVVEGAALAPA